MITVPRYMMDLRTIPNMSYGHVAQYHDVHIGHRDDAKCNFVWGGVAGHGGHNMVIETGFFWEAAHVDTCGLYGDSALNTRQGVSEIKEFCAPVRAMDVITRMPQQSKYQQTRGDVQWDGVVLASQNPGDRSIVYNASPDAFYDFVKGACEYYQDRLFIKLHPWNSSRDVVDRIAAYAKANGCRYAKTNHSVIQDCEFVIVWNSTFGMDCFVRNVPVAQFAPGYWHMTGAVTFTDGVYPDSVDDTLVMAHKLANFCTWKYCFNYQQSTEQWIKMLRHFAQSSELFPMTPEFCYANNTHWSI